MKNNVAYISPPYIHVLFQARYYTYIDNTDSNLATVTQYSTKIRNFSNIYHTLYEIKLKM